MSRQDDLQRVIQSGIVAVIRSQSSDQLVQVAEALYEGGVDVLEVTFTVPRALEIIAAVRQKLGNKVLLGAGTVLDPETARAALLAGAEYIVSPVVNTDVIKLCSRYDKMAMPGAFTPTEVLTAWEAGASVVKVFPADLVGPQYLKILHGPLPQVRLMPTGGVNLKTIGEFLRAGACAVGIGGSLIDQQAIREGQFGKITSLAAQYVELVKATRAELAAK